MLDMDQMRNAKHILDDVTELIGATPLIRLKRIPDAGGAEILGKLESLNPGGSLKDRACLNMIQEAEARGELRAGSTIIEPTSGNTGIGLAMIAAVKGYRCILTMPEAMSLERIYLLRLYGAEVVLTPTREGIPGAMRKAEELAAKIPQSFIPRQFDNPSNPDAHRKSTAQEILVACEGKLDAFVAGVGTGGTITGTGEALKKALPHVKIIAVEPSKSAVLSGKPAGHHIIQGIGAGFVPKTLNRAVIDQIIPIDDHDAFVMMKRLGAEEGLSLGISSGAVVVAAARIAKDLGPGKRVVAMLCDTGDRYFTMEQYFEA
jgi:cysteine synthase A